MTDPSTFPQFADFSDLPPLREVIREHGLRAEKALGQNFLLDQNLTDKIVRQAGDVTGLNVFEIGPGPGGLTRSLLRAGAQKVIAVEFDPRAISALRALEERAGGMLTLVQGDALKTDLTALSPAPRAIVANLPYNISTALLTAWLAQIRKDPNVFSFMALMFQKEVAERILAGPGTKTYGRLSVMSQWLCDTRKLFDLPPSAFTPPPKVTSSVVLFRPKQLSSDAPSFGATESVVAAAFQQRRKMIRSSLADWSAALEKTGVDQTKRAEELSVAEFESLAKVGRNAL